MKRISIFGLFLGGPLLIPALFSYYVWAMNTQNEYPTVYSKEKIRSLTEKTIRVVSHNRVQSRHVQPSEWKISYKKETNYNRINRVKPNLVPKKAKPVAVIQPEPQDFDPFIENWQQVSIQTHRYANYAKLEGAILLPIRDLSLFVDVMFVDRLGFNGLETRESTVLEGRTLYNGRKGFILRIPSESQGYLLAKAYHESDREKKNPLFVGAYPLNPVHVPKKGLSNLIIPLESYGDYIKARESVFVGKVSSEYDLRSCLSGVHVWVVETKAYAKTNDQCLFMFRDLEPSRKYRLIFEKRGFITKEASLFMKKKRFQQSFAMSPESKYTNGYDVFLGARLRDKSTVFATLRKDGKPLKRGILMSPRAEKIVYERKMGSITIPDPTLYSTDEHGRVLLWNATPGRHRMDIYHNGELMGQRTVRLSPGIVHHVNIDF